MNDKGSSITIRIAVVRMAVMLVGTIMIDGEVVKKARSRSHWALCDYGRVIGAFLACHASEWMFSCLRGHWSC
jgi:hypothetical protein